MSVPTVSLLRRRYVNESHDSPGLWNTNWYSNIILIPGLVGNACLLLLQLPSPGDLTPTQYSNCTRFTSRSFNTFTYPVIGGVGTLTGANTLDVASIGVSQGLLQGNESILTTAYAHIHDEVQIQTPPRADGIRPDGSFGQHAGLLYDGRCVFSRFMFRSTYVYSQAIMARTSELLPEWTHPHVLNTW